MNRLTTDVAILGAGTAGLTARRAVEKAGKRAILVDPGPFGTTCARVGCMPSKLLLAAAEAAHHTREASVFGVHTTLSIDGPAVMQRVQRERDRFVGFVLDTIDSLQHEGKLVKGRGRFIEPNAVMVDDHTRIEATTFVLATGSTPNIPYPYSDLEHRLLTNEHIFELPDLPESLLVVGAGVIGLELGQAFHRLGVRVTILGRGGDVGHLSDPKVQRVALEVFTSELDLHPNAEVHSVRDLDGGVELTFTDRSGARRCETYQHVLLAAGRYPNHHHLGIEAAGLSFDAQGLLPFDRHTMQIGDSHIFIAGDANADRVLLHEAADEGRIAGENAARFPEFLVKPRSVPLSIVFSDPQIAVVGEPWHSMSCHDHRVGEVDYSRQGRSRVMNQNKGWVRIYGEAGTGRLLGAEMLGPRVEHTAHLLAWAIQHHLTVSQALEMPFYHPVIEEGIRTALRDLQTQTRLARKPGAVCEEFGPGT